MMDILHPSSFIPHPYLLALILVIYLFVVVGYGVINPLFEAPDEQYHYFTAQAIAETGQLPFVGEVPDEWMGQEAAQSPLYYLLAAALVRLVDTSEAREQVWFNPRVQLGDASSPINRNAFIHTAVEAWPWTGYVLAAHLVRILSALLGLATLLFIYGSARLIWPAAPENALLTTALVAFLPQFAFHHGAVSNDSLIILTSAAALWQLLRLWYGRVTRWRLLLLGLTLGLAILSKMTGLLLLIYAVGFLMILIWRDGRGATDFWRASGEMMGLVLLPALLVSGWLLWRNWLLYGDITATSQFVHVAGGHRDFTIWQVLGESTGLYSSLFAVFGWFNVRPPDWVYWIWNGLVLLAALGVARFKVSGSRFKVQGFRFKVSGSRFHFSLFTFHSFLHQPWFPALLLAGWLGLIYAALVHFMLQTPAAQGRLLFPALLPLVLALTYGLAVWRQRWLYLAAPTLALVTTLYCLFVAIPNAYARPPALGEADIPPTAVRFHTDMGQGLELVAVELETEAARPGDQVWLTLYWRRHTAPPAATSGENAPEWVLELFGRQTELVGKLQSYHGGGLYPANLWTTGDIIAERVAVRLEKDMVVPAEVRANLKLVNGPTSLDAATLKVTPTTWPPFSSDILAEWGDGVQLTAVAIEPGTARPGDWVRVAVSWQVTAAPGLDLTTFVHLGESGQAPLANGDSPPLAGHYPTRYWAAGEVIEDGYTLILPADLPDGRYPIWIGLYDPHSLMRIPLKVGQVRQPNDAYLAGWLVVGSE